MREIISDKIIFKELNKLNQYFGILKIVNEITKKNKPQDKL